MNLVDEYLRAVSLLLPKAQREDITAELRDTVLSRIEAREETLGRALTDDETEAVLREIGHPVVIAARYREGPQHVVGPAVYPYWAFVVKAVFAIQVAVAVLVLFARAMAGGDFAYALGQAISSLVSGGIVLVGIATIAAWLIERQGVRIGYFDTWRVRDLRFLEYVAWDWDTLRDGLAGRGWPGQAHWRRPGPPPPPSSPPPSSPRPNPPSSSSSSASSGARAQAEAGSAPRTDAPPSSSASSLHMPSAPPPPPVWSPMGRGAALLAGGALLVLWWLGLMRFDFGLSPAELRANGLEPGALADVDWDALRMSLFWPVLAYGAAIFLRGVVQVAYPWAVRLHGLLEAMTGAAVTAFGAWLWTASPLAPAIRVDGFEEFVEHLAPLEGHAFPLPVLGTVVVAILVVAGLCSLMRGLWDLMAGPPPVAPWAAYGI